jgi:chromosome segregation ATPase
LIQATIKFCGSVFAPESLDEIATTDEESINAWAIALMQTLQSQLILLDGWQPRLTTLPLPETLQEKIRDRATQLQQISQQQSELLQSTATLFSQEAELRQGAEALQQLKKKAQILKRIKSELKTTDLNALREQISLQAIAIAPQREELENLKQQKAELDREVTYLQQQRHNLESQITYLQQRQQRLETATSQSAQQLISVTNGEKERLSQELNILLTDLSSQQEAYQQIQQQLATAIADSNRYQQETEKLRQYLQQHYQANQEIAQNLPVNQQKIQQIVKSIEQNLAELDQELAQVLQQQAESKQKTIFTFS